MLNDFAKTILYLSLSGSLIAIVLLLLKPFIQGRVSKKWYYYAWIIVIVRLVMPYSLPIPIIGDTVNPEADYNVTAEFDTAAGLPLLTVINERVGFQLPQQRETPALENVNGGIETYAAEPVSDPVQKDFHYFQSLSPFLGLIWLSIALISLVKKLLSYHNFARFVKSGSRLMDDEAILKSYTDTCQSFGMKKALPVYTHLSINSPMLIGLLKPILVLPEKQTKNIPQLKYVFMHELTHYKRFDIFYKWLMQIVLCLHWFNPVVYLAGKEVNMACELSCDEAVIKKLTFQEQRAYGDTLLCSLELLCGYSNSAVSLTLAENSKLMKERLSAIMKYRRKSKLAVFLSALLTVALCTGAAFTGAQAAIISSNKEVMPSNITNASDVTAEDLQNLQSVSNTTITAHAYSGKWASATGIEGDTYKKQLDEKIKWVEDLYSEKKEKFLLKEAISEEEITNTLGIRYMYEQSSVYRDMVNTGSTFKLLPYDLSFSRTGSNNFYERSVFYVDQTAMMNLSISFDLTEGRLGLMVVSPEGKAIYAGTPLSRCNYTVTLPLEKGLWSFITINESETGAIKGTQKIEGSIASAENFVVPIDIPELKANETTSYGPYYLSKKQALSVDIESFTGNGTLFVADMIEGEAPSHSVAMEKAPDGFAFLADESKYYYITIGNDSDAALTNIKGKLTLDFKGIYQSSDKKEELTALSGNTNEIRIDIPQIAPDGHKSYGPYSLKAGDVVSSDLTWSNDDGGVYFAIGKEFMDFKGFYSGYGKYGKHLKKDITVQEDGVYYIFVGNSSTLEPEVKNVAGTIAINDSAKLLKQNYAYEENQKTKISVDIPSVTGIGFVKPYGKYSLSRDNNVYADITWKGSGYVMLLYTKENLSTDDIAALIDKGVLPLGGGGKFLGAGTEITSNFAYQPQNKEIVYNLTTSADEISKTMSVPSEGDYYFYVIARSNTAITDIKGDIYINKKVNTTHKTGEKLPRMNTWIGSAGEKETPTGIVYNSKNFTGDRINYEFSSEENGSKTIKFNSSLTGEYEIVFIASDRTILKTIPPFTGNKEITLTGLPEDTISMIVYSVNVSGSLSVDIPADVIQTSNKLANTKSISESNSYLYEGGVAANNLQYGNPFPAQKGDTVTISLTDELSGWQLDKDKITIKVVIGGNDGTTQEVILSNKETEKTITIKENANHHITIHNANNQLVNYSFILVIKSN